MLLTFSKEEFIELISKGVKIHTIRSDIHNRWKAGNKIHFWFGNPRNTRGKKKPFHFGLGEVSKVDKIVISKDSVYIGEKKLYTEQELSELAVNDGFENWQQMKSWFIKDNEIFKGKIIYWKNYKSL
jgi:hypothetical protein